MSILPVSTLSHSLTLSARVEHTHVSPGLLAFRLSYSASSAVPTFLAKIVREQVIEGVATPDAVDAFARGGVAEVVRLPGCLMATAEFLATARKLGFLAAVATCTENGKDSTGLRSDVYTAIVDEGLSPENLTVVDYSAHMLFSVDGTVRSTGFNCGYIEAGMHDGNYDLKKLVAALKDDPRVTFLVGRKREPGPAAIQDIPYYNASEGRSAYVEFVYGPTAQEAVALWAQMKSYGTQYPSTQLHRAMQDLDVLGLAKAGARKPVVAEVL